MYKKIAITIAVFVHNVLASTHFVASFVATNMFLIYLPTNFIGPPFYNLFLWKIRD